MVSGWKKRISWGETIFVACLLLLPLLIVLVWGTYLNGNGYNYLEQVRQLAQDRRLTDQLSFEGTPTVIQSPAFTLFLLFLYWLGLPLRDSAVMISALGWGVAAVAIFVAGRLSRQLLAGAAGALLVAMAPIFLDSLATPRAWCLAIVILAIVATWRQLWKLQAALLLLALLTYFSPITFLLAIGLLSWRWSREGRPPLLIALILAIISAGWMMLASQLAGDVLFRIGFDLDQRVTQFDQVGYPVEWYWLILPLVGVGLFGLYRLLPTWWPLGLLCLGLLATIIIDGPLGVLLVTVTILLLVALGLAYLLQTLIARRSQEPDRYPGKLTLAVILVLPLLLFQGLALVRQIADQPVEYWQMERRAGRWLEEQSDEASTVFASPQVRYFAERAMFQEAAGVDELESAAVSPDYLVLARSLAADQLTGGEWFQERYEAVEIFTSPFDAAAPLTVWGYRPTIFHLGDSQPANVKTDYNLEIVGYRTDPNRIQPGQVVDITLYFRATGPTVKSFEPLFRLVGPEGGVAVDMVAPPVSEVSAWLPGQVIRHDLTLTTAEEISEGAYQLRLSLRTPGEENVWGLYKNEDRNPLDSISLGYAGVLRPVSSEEIVPVEARFGEQIVLAGYTVADEYAPGGEPVDVTLFWRPEGTPSQEYVVFVHLLDQDGQFIVGQDSQPVEGRFPTTAWLPGDLIADRHLLPLPDSLPAGTYRINIGLYLPDSGDRLSITDGQGNEPPDRALPLTTITIP